MGWWSHAALTILLALQACAPAPSDKSPDRLDRFKAWTMPPLHRLDLTGWRLSFHDTFDRRDVTGMSGLGPWFAPGHSDFGAAAFAPADDLAAFGEVRQRGCEDGCLGLSAYKSRGAWRGALMRSVDSAGRGATFTFAYFEVRAKLPIAPAAWPAFWLLTVNGLQNPTATRGEIDVFEHYGANPVRLHTSLHLWPASAPAPGGLTRALHTSRRPVRLDLAFGFHRYGVMVGPRWVTFYVDGQAVARHATFAAFRAPKYMLVDLAMTDKGLAHARSPVTLLVDDIRVYTPPPQLVDY